MGCPAAAIQRPAWRRTVNLLKPDDAQRTADAPPPRKRALPVMTKKRAPDSQPEREIFARNLRKFRVEAGLSQRRARQGHRDRSGSRLRDGERDAQHRHRHHGESGAAARQAALSLLSALNPICKLAGRGLRFLETDQNVFEAADQVSRVPACRYLNRIRDQAAGALHQRRNAVDLAPPEGSPLCALWQSRHCCSDDPDHEDG